MKTITELENVYANGIAAGIKKDPSQKDLAYIYVPNATASAGVFTKNQFMAPCLKFTKKSLKNQTLKAVIINAGNANAGTGKQGYDNAKKTAKLAQGLLKLKHKNQVGVASTGIIGVQLPMEKVEKGIQKLLKNPFEKKGHFAATAIMTTDLIQKEVFLEEKIGKTKIQVAGIAKGSGMIAPNMGTMLCFIVTNAYIPTKKLQSFLNTAVEKSFNMISVDTDTSTNDMVLLFSTGTNQTKLASTQEEAQFQALLSNACITLAKLIAKDGEGAEKLIEVEVLGVKKKSDAKKIALNVVNSPLVKTAIHGADPNWGRIIAAAAKDPNIPLKTKKMELLIQNELIFKNEQATNFNRKTLIALLKKEEIKISINLHIGKQKAIAWGCDLTKKYVDINTAYC